MSGYGRKAWEIVGYVYGAELLCPEDMHRVALSWDDTTPAAADMDVEPLLDQVAAYRLVEREDESSYDSDEFPKIVFSSDASGEHCTRCGSEL